MSRRKNDPDWYPALGQARAETALREAVRDLIRIYDLGERVPASMFRVGQRAACTRRWL